MSGVVTFTGPSRSAASAVAALQDLGFVVGPVCPVTRTILDTFDGRLHAAGLRLELRRATSSGTIELTMTGAGDVPTSVSTATVPRFVGDVPSGPLRDRLAEVIDVRALCPVLQLDAITRRAGWIDRAGTVTATAVLHEDMAVDGPDDAEFLAWSIELHEVGGRRHAADAARRALERCGATATAGDTLDAVVAIVPVDLTGTQASLKVDIDAGMPAVDGFRVVLANLADTMCDNWQGTIDDVDPEFLHDVRVAVRRTRAIVTQGRKVLPPSLVEEAGERFRWLGALTGPPRDLDVYLIGWDGYTRPLDPAVAAALAPVRSLLDARRDDAHRALTEALRSSAATTWMARWAAWVHGADEVAGPAGVHADRPLGRVVAKRIERTHAVLLAHGRRIAPDTPGERLHDLRKDCKKLRYLVECFGTLLPGASRKAFTKRLKHLQDILGAHQDAEIHITELHAIAGELRDLPEPSDTMAAIGQLTEVLDEHRLAARAAFADRFDAFDAKKSSKMLADALAACRR